MRAAGSLFQAQPYSGSSVDLYSAQFQSQGHQAALILFVWGPSARSGTQQARQM